MHIDDSTLMRSSFCILGLPFDRVNLNDSIQRLNSGIDELTSCFLSTPNLNFAISSQSDEAFFRSVVDSDLSVVDGMPLIWVAKLLGIPIKDRVAGSTLFDELSKQSREDKIRVFFFGGQDGVAEKAHRKLNESSAGMVSCGFYGPGFVSLEEMSAPNIIDKINDANPDFIVVALGAKKGQQWIQKNREQLTAPVISHLGAVINFVAGSIERAPVSWQRMGLEWVWRIKQEPALWRRYFFDGVSFVNLLITKVFPLAIYDRFLRRCSFFNVPCDLDRSDKNSQVVKLKGSFHYQRLEKPKLLLSSILNDVKGTLIFDFSEVTYVDAAFLATLLLFQNELLKKETKFLICNLNARVNRLFIFNNVLNRFNQIIE